MVEKVERFSGSFMFGEKHPVQGLGGIIVDAFKETSEGPRVLIKPEELDEFHITSEERTPSKCLKHENSESGDYIVVFDGLDGKWMPRSNNS